MLGLLVERLDLLPSITPIGRVVCVRDAARLGHLNGLSVRDAVVEAVLEECLALAAHHFLLKQVLEIVEARPTVGIPDHVGAVQAA